MAESDIGTQVQFPLFHKMLIVLKIRYIVRAGFQNKAKTTLTADAFSFVKYSFQALNPGKY